MSTPPETISYSDGRPGILVIEDDQSLNDQLCEFLNNHGYLTTPCFRGDEGLNLAVSRTFNLILLDIMLPGQDGLTVLSILRSCNDTPVMVLSAKHAEEERIRGLSAGADDYLSKPFNTEELLLRVDAILRRSMKGNSLQHGELQIDDLKTVSRQQEIFANGQALQLTPTEYGLLTTLMRNHTQVLSKVFLYQTILHRAFSQYDRSLDMHMSRVRKKLSGAGWDGSRLQTVHGKGYCLR